MQVEALGKPSHVSRHHDHELCRIMNIKWVILLSPPIFSLPQTFPNVSLPRAPPLAQKVQHIISETMTCPKIGQFDEARFIANWPSAMYAILDIMSPEKFTLISQ